LLFGAGAASTAALFRMQKREQWKIKSVSMALQWVCPAQLAQLNARSSLQNRKKKDYASSDRYRL